MKWQKFTNN